MKKLEYYPNELARALFKNETYTVGLIFLQLLIHFTLS